MPVTLLCAPITIHSTPQIIVQGVPGLLLNPAWIKSVNAILPRNVLGRHNTHTCCSACTINRDLAQNGVPPLSLGSPSLFLLPA